MQPGGQTRRSGPRLKPSKSPPTMPASTSPGGTQYPLPKGARSQGGSRIQDRGRQGNWRPPGPLPCQESHSLAPQPPNLWWCPLQWVSGKSQQNLQGGKPHPPGMQPHPHLGQLRIRCCGELEKIMVSSWKLHEDTSTL